MNRVKRFSEFKLNEGREEDLYRIINQVLSNTLKNDKEHYYTEGKEDAVEHILGLFGEVGDRVNLANEIESILGKLDKDKGVYYYNNKEVIIGQIIELLKGRGII